MPRIQLTPLRSYCFRTTITVRITDLNYGGHLGNDTLLSLAHEARVQFLAGGGYSEKDIHGVSLIMADTAVVYKGEAFAGDTLLFELAAGEPTRYGFRIFYRIHHAESGKPVALIENGMVCFDYQKRRPVPLPRPFGEWLNKNNGEYHDIS